MVNFITSRWVTISCWLHQFCIGLLMGASSCPEKLLRPVPKTLLQTEQKQWNNCGSRGGSHRMRGANRTAVSGKAKQLSAPTLHGSPFGTLTRRAKCAKIRNSTGTLCRSMCQQSFTRKIQPKTPSEPGELQARTICHSQKLFVK